ncbi:hypothetical protein LCGC14_1434640 [marine sediment metagenome]|uniref:Uncharacterized protein n=1 Tax=marine sediment metagenome TaxID=412755 RepID=A0A0F9M321_9ZZZZ
MQHLKRSFNVFAVRYGVQNESWFIFINLNLIEKRHIVRIVEGTQHILLVKLMTQYVTLETRYKCCNCEISCTKREMNDNIFGILSCPNCSSPMIFRKTIDDSMERI